VNPEEGMVFEYDHAQFLDRGKGVRSLPLSGPESGSQLILSGMTEIPQGGEIPLHYHNTDEFILVLEGHAIVSIAGEDRSVKAMDSTLVHEGVHHRYVNVGKGLLRILWVYGDMETTRTIVATGVTLRHLDRYDQ
jgi:putative monooxygenase